MRKTYFPGANSGIGFFSRFSGIVPKWDSPHYTYVLKGGPGVGKNTLMKKVAKCAAEKGYEVEEFRCASDPSSLDAVRVAEKGIVLLDGTAPHSIDPVLPGVCDEVIDLGHFKRQTEFVTFRGELERLFCENKRHYRAAYSMLGAAHALKKEALLSVGETVNKEKLATLLQGAKNGEKRELFARSATPKGVVDYADTFLPKEVITFSGIVGEATLLEAVKMLDGKQCEVYYDFVLPDCPRAIIFDGGALAVSDDDAELPKHITFLLSECERLVANACEEFSMSLSTHDKIEEIYRDYVDYDRVNEEAEKLLKKVM